jgi:quinol monooxygenase YgiN
MIVVSGEIDIQEQSWPMAIPAAIEMMHASQKEEGCVQYSFYAHIEMPGRFHVYEEWESAEALAAHMETEHMATWRATLSNLEVLGRWVKKMEVTNMVEI